MSDLQLVYDDRDWYAKLAAECRAEADALTRVADRLDARAARSSERPIDHAEHDREWRLLAEVDKAIDAFGQAVVE